MSTSTRLVGMRIAWLATSVTGRLAWLLFLGVLLQFGCTSLPQSDSMLASTAFTDTEQTRLGLAVRRVSLGHPDQSGFIPLQSGLVAFAARFALAEAAQRSLDVQYYIWHNDEIGQLFSAALLRAADRGVRVRLLLDDWGVYNADTALAAMDLHPNIEIRLFNPFKFRSLRKMETVFSFSRINRRMHNKSFTADNQLTIVGGRNIGREYFDAHDDVNFSDLDLMSVGPLVNEVSYAFDQYWNSQIAVPVSDLIARPDNGELPRLRVTLADHFRAMSESPYMQTVKESEPVRKLINGQIRLFWGEAHVVYDEPEKVITSTGDRDAHLVSKLHPLLRDTHQELIIVSPYYIPGKAGVERFAQLIEQGLRIKVLTNSLASTDVGIVYAGYRPYIVPMLKAGIELYEAKPEINRNRDGKDEKSRIGSSSRSSLHTKLYVFDRKKIFVGSLNLDPRSTVLNTELGIVFTNKEFGELVAQSWDKQIRNTSYQLRLVDDPNAAGEEEDIFRLRWFEYTEEGVIERKVEPHVGFWRRLGVDLLGVLPIESQL